jgi:hypothetical protein
MSKSNGQSEVSSYNANLRRMEWLLSDLYTPIEAQEWLTSEHKLLGGRSPTQLIAGGRTREVEQLIEQIREGVFL